MSRIAAVMVNWNGGSLAVDSARSIAQQSHPTDLWIVDNNSVDGSLEAILSACPDTTAIRNKSNTGFAHANNQALQQLDPQIDYVLVINNDVILPDVECLSNQIRLLEADLTIQGLCGRYEYPDGRFQHFYNQLPDHIVLMTNWGILRHFHGALTSRRMRRFVLADADFSRPMTIEQPAFSCEPQRCVP